MRQFRQAENGKIEQERLRNTTGQPKKIRCKNKHEAHLVFLSLLQHCLRKGIGG